MLYRSIEPNVHRMFERKSNAYPIADSFEQIAACADQDCSAKVSHHHSCHHHHHALFSLHDRLQQIS
jgi:hypothetical protein